MLLLLLVSLVLVVSADDCPIRTNVNEKVQQELQMSQLQFSADLLQAVANPDLFIIHQNVIISPSSVYNAFLLAYFSSGGSTTPIVKRILRIPDNVGEESVLDAYIERRSSPVIPSANYIYVPIEAKVKACMELLFPEEIQRYDPNGDYEGAIRQINRQVANRTRNMITDLLPVIPKVDLSIVLINTAIFKSNWTTKFDKSLTSVDQFTLADGGIVQAVMMKQFANFSRTLNKELQAAILELPYGDDISMFVFLPEDKNRSISNLLSKLTGPTLFDAFESVIQSKKQETIVTLPKFSAKLESDLKKVLSSMGGEALFTNLADFSTLLEEPNKYSITKAVHEAFIQVNEDGTEAGAFTEVDAKNRIPSPFFTANRPFIYTIYNKKSKLLLFTGIFNHPDGIPNL